MDEHTTYEVKTGLNYPDGEGGEKRIEAGTTLDLTTLPEKEQAALKASLPWLIEQGVLVPVSAEADTPAPLVNDSDDAGGIANADEDSGAIATSDEAAGETSETESESE